MSYPDTLQFTREHCPETIVTLSRQPHLTVPLWAVISSHGIGYNALYNEAQIQYNFDNGYWQEMSSSEAPCSKVSQAEEAVEPEMKFPFTFYIPRHQEAPYKVTKQGPDLRLESSLGVGYQTVEFAKNAIKNGDWIVTSVGEQPAKEEAVKVGKLEDISITLRCDTSEALAKTYELADAIERVNIAMESFQAIVKDFNINVEAVDSTGCAAFCCDN